MQITSAQGTGPGHISRLLWLMDQPLIKIPFLGGYQFIQITFKDESIFQITYYGNEEEDMDVIHIPSLQSNLPGNLT